MNRSFALGRLKTGAMNKKPIVVVYKESLLQSILADSATFGFLALCIWASQGSTWWTFFTGVMFLVYAICSVTIAATKGKRVYSTDELRTLADKIDGESR